MGNFPGVISKLSEGVRRTAIALRYYQREVKDGILTHWSSAPADKESNVMAVMPTGAGKCLAPGTPVMMHDGTVRRVEDVRTGDLVMGPDSLPRRVESITSGSEQMYKVTPIKGDPYTVNESHILSLRLTGNKSATYGGDGVRYMPGDIANITVRDYLQSSKTFRHCAKGWRVPVDFSASAPSDIPPYILGVWLGDGTEARVACITNQDPEVIVEWHQWGGDIGATVRVEAQQRTDCCMHFLTGNASSWRNSPAMNALRQVGVHGNRHIPDGYKFTRRADRLQLLAGLLDTDGHLSNGGFDVVFKSQRLAQDTAWLARSLGLAAYVAPCQKKCTNTGTVGDYFRISISGDVSQIPCKVPRRQAPPRRQVKNVLNVGITVEPVGIGTYHGFTLSGPDRLFLLGDFTVTHNTVLMADIVSEHTGAAVLIAHRQELVAQISLTLNQFGVRHRLICSPEVRKLIIARHLKEHRVTYHDAGAMVGVGGVDTVVRLGKRPELDTWRRSVTLGLQDEAHHVLRENKWGKAALEFPACKRWLLVTATPERPDGRGLGRHADGIADALVVGPGMRELIDDGYLCPYKVWTIPHKVDYSQVAVGASGEFVQARLVAAEDCDKKLVGNIVSTYRLRVPGKRAICFMSSVKKAEETAKAFRDAGVPAAAVDGSTPDHIREKTVEDLADGKLLVLVNCDLVGEGVDVPAVEVVIMGTRTASFIRFTQWWGRMLRLMLSGAERQGYDLLDSAGRRARIAASAKPFGVVIDHGGNLIQHNGPPDLRSAPWSLDRRERRSSGSGDAIPYRVCANRGMELDGMEWEEARALGLTDTDLLDGGLAREVGLPCATPYAAIHRCCPCCGYMPMPARPSTPREVDGDLQLLDIDELRALTTQSEHARVTPGQLRERLAATGLGEIKVEANVKRHREKLAAHAELDRAMADWGGIWHAAGESDSTIQRRFFHTFGLDVMSAQALGRADAVKLTERIDATVKGA